MIVKMNFKCFTNLVAAQKFADKFNLVDIFTDGKSYFVVPIIEWDEDTESRFLFEDKANLYRESLDDSRKPAFDKWLATMPYCYDGDKKLYTSLGFPSEAKVFSIINTFKKGGE